MGSSVVEAYEYGMKVFMGVVLVALVAFVCLIIGAFHLGRMVEEDSYSVKLKAVGIKEIEHNYSCVNGVNTNWYEIIWIKDVKKEGNN